MEDEKIIEMFNWINYELASGKTREDIIKQLSETLGSGENFRTLGSGDESKPKTLETLGSGDESKPMI